MDKSKMESRPSITLTSRSLHKQVKATSLDKYFPAGSRLDLVKIDIEGAADSAFTGMRRLMKEARPVLVIEFHGEKEWGGKENIL